MEQFQYHETIDRSAYFSEILDFLLRSPDLADEQLVFLLKQVETCNSKLTTEAQVSNYLCKMVSTIYSVVFSRLLSNGYLKLQVNLVELTETFVSHLNPVKLSSKNVFTLEKKMSVVCLNTIFSKFSGFLNSYKIPLLTSCYKHVKKLCDQTSISDSHYLNCFLSLISTILNTNPILDSKIFHRLFKLYKTIGSRSKTYFLGKESFNYSILSVIYVNNITDILLRSPFYVNSIVSAKKSAAQNPLHYLNTIISPYLAYFISVTDTSFKQLRLSLTKNITNLLIFNYINYAVDENEAKVFHHTFNYLWNQYRAASSNRVKIAVLETFVQFMSTCNLMSETGILSSNSSSRNFVSLKSFEILTLTMENVFSNEAVNNGTPFSVAITQLNHLDFFYSHLLKEIKSDVNKLILLQFIYDEVIDVTKVLNNPYRLMSLLRLSQLLIADLDEFILTHDTSKIEQTLLNIASLENPHLRVLAIQTLSSLHIDYDKIVASSHRELTDLFEQKPKHEREDTFILTHSKSLLIASILSTNSSVSMDSILSILSFANSILKKFNSNVLINNMINGNDYSTLSNLNYEKQVSGWILMMGLLNYYQRTKNHFLLNSNQLLNIWKTLLAHNMPPNFFKLENGSLVYASEMMKFLEIKNYALSCLICFIDYAISLNALPLDFARHLTPLLTKCYSFIVTIEQTLTPNAHLVSDQIFKTIQIQRLRILSNFVKILPHIINLSDEVNISTDMLINIVNNFNDLKAFNYGTNTGHGHDNYSLYQLEDGLAFGLTSKVNLFQVDELLFKHVNAPQLSVSTGNELDIDLIPNSSDFIIESRDAKSDLLAISKLDELERSLYQPIRASIINDYLFPLISNSKPYSNTKLNAVPVDTAIVDLSIELFQFVFPYLSLKIQQSILEHIRTGILDGSQADSLNSDKTTSAVVHDQRQKAVLVNSSIAIHGMLNHLHVKNVLHLKFNRMIVNLILESLKGIVTEDLIVINLNAESVGLCLSVLEDDTLKHVNETTNYFVNRIVENNEPYSRVFSALSIANICKFNPRSSNSKAIIDVILKLLVDPHPVVHHWSLQSLLLTLENFANLTGSNQLFAELFKVIQKIHEEDEFGLYTKSTISSNLHLSFQGCDKNVLLIKLIRDIVKILGPATQTLSEKKLLRSLILEIMCLTTSNYDLVCRELLVLFDDLRIFDNSSIGEQIYQQFLKFSCMSNIKTGVYNENLDLLPLINLIIGSKQTDNELFTMNSSDKLLMLSLNSLHQIIKVTTSGEALYSTLDEDLQNLIWMLLESDDTQILQIFELWIELDFTTLDSNETKVKWFEKLISRYSATEKELYAPLNNLFKQKLNANASLFITKLKKSATISTNKSQAGEESRSFATLDDSRADDENESDSSEEANAITSLAGADTSTSSESNIANEEGAINDVVIGAKVQKISEEEPVRWQFKLKILKLLTQLMSYLKKDEFWFKFLASKLSDLVKISFVSATSQISQLKFAGLKLLRLILETYSSVKDPLYDNLSILDQQQAQIISAILPAFAHGSGIELISEGFKITSILIGSHITSLTRLQRLVKVLVSSLRDLCLLRLNKKAETSLKIGEVEIKSTKDQDRITLAVLDAWATMKIYCHDDELKDLIAEHSKMLTSLWIYSLKQYSMLKYGEKYVETEEIPLEVYNKYWKNMMIAISIVIKEDPDSVSETLGAEVNNFFFMIFAQCVEILFKRKSDVSDVLVILRNVLTLKSASTLIYHDLIFEEVVDLFDKLISTVESDKQSILLDIISELYVSYFDNKLSQGKEEQDIHGDVDKLFELLRLVISIVNQRLPFVKDREIEMSKLKPLTESDLQLVKKSFATVILMIERLPLVIQRDLYSCLLFMFNIIYELDNNDIIGLILPHLKKILNELSGEDVIESFFVQLVPHLRRTKSTNSLITYMIFIGSVKEIEILEPQDIEHVSELLLSFLEKDETAAISTRSIKTLMIQNNENVNISMLLKSFIPELIKFMITFKEPRIIIELIIIFTKHSEDQLSALMLVIPILLWYSEENKAYVNQKILDLIQFAPDSFKGFVSQCLSEEEKPKIEALVKYHIANESGDLRDKASQNQHINLKMFGDSEDVQN